METKKTINERALKAINNCLEKRLEKNKAAMADAFGISTQKFAEIMGERMLVGTEILSRLVERYDISACWLLTGRGEMLRTDIQQTVIGNQNTAVAGTSNTVKQDATAALIEHLQQEVKSKGEQINTLLGIVQSLSNSV